MLRLAPIEGENVNEETHEETKKLESECNNMKRRAK